MNLEMEMNTANVVSHIERILLPTQKKEWVIIAESITDASELFESMLEFLLKEKRVIKYMTSNIRAGQPGIRGRAHNTSVNQDQEEATHAIREIHTQQEEIIKSIADINHVVMNMVTGRASDRTSNKCWLHSSDGHAIVQCVTFQRLDNQGEMDALLKYGICFNCFKGYYTASNCNSKKTYEVLNEHNQRCGRPHHPTPKASCFIR